MNYVIIHIRPDGPDMMEWINAAGGEEHDPVEEPGRYYFKFSACPNGFMYVSKDDEVLELYDDEERAMLDAIIDRPVQYFVEWGGGDETLVEFLKCRPPSMYAVIDNDCDIICDVRLVENRPLEEWLRVWGPKDFTE